MRRYLSTACAMFQAHCQCHGDGGMSLPCHSCFDVSPYSAILVSLQQSLLGGKPVTVLCDFLLAFCKIVFHVSALFQNFHARRLQIIARMAEGTLPRAFSDVCQRIWQLREVYCSFVFPYAFTSTLPQMASGRRTIDTCSNL